MTRLIYCIIGKRISLLLLILPYISFSGLQSWNLVHTWTVGWCIMYTWIRLLVLIYSFISSIFSLMAMVVFVSLCSLSAIFFLSKISQELLHLEFWNLVQMLGMTLYCVRENQPPLPYLSLYLSIFLSLQLNFLSQISWLLWKPETSNFIYTLRVAKYTVGKKNKLLRFIFAFFFHLSLQCNT